jgi:hypothetical protein
MVAANRELSPLMSSLRPTTYESGPTAFFDPDGDCIEFFATRDMYFARRIDDLMTFYYSQETDKLVGFQIKGARRFLASIKTKYPGYSVIVDDGHVKLHVLFVAHLLSLPPNLPTMHYYKEVLQLTDGTDASVSTELCGIA